MKIRDLTRKPITEEYSQELVDFLLEAADAPKSKPMSADELMESLNLEED